jgi:hypothetical protein
MYRGGGRMKTSGEARTRGDECCTAGIRKVGRPKGRTARKTAWMNTFLDLAAEVVSEARAASSPRAKKPGELAALKDRMEDRRIQEHQPRGSQREGVPDWEKCS